MWLKVAEGWRTRVAIFTSCSILVTAVVTVQCLKKELSLYGIISVGCQVAVAYSCECTLRTNEQN